MTFREWVEKWQIGPGMNDGHPTRVKRHGTQALYSGFDGTVGEGWVPILDRLAADLVAMGWDRDLHQVKEKWAGLRFDIGKGTPEMFDRIDAAELESKTVCEECGRAGEVREGGWLVTLCDGCEAKRKAKR